jgi:Peptidase C13 family
LLLLLLRRRWPPSFVAGFDAVAALVVLNLAVWALLDRLHAERHAEFVSDALFGWACYLLLGLLACALIARAQSRAAPTRPLLTVALSVAPFALTLLWLLGDLNVVAQHPLTSGALAILYLALLALRVLGAAFGPLRMRPALLALALVLASPWMIGWLDLDTRLWVPPDTSEAQDDLDPGEAEALLYDQPARIAAVVERVTPSEPPSPSEPPTPHAYFVGFAGDADPEVFSREAQFARQVFATRFGSADRSVLLVNDADDRDSWPLASLSGLSQTLKLLATRMDPDEDVLVLFLTSHGSADGLEVRNGSLPLAQLAPEDLRQALDDSGIRWRVVVVSACYAGVFVDALKNDTTAIVTAADAAHSSFGCQEDRELTWFGEAFLKDSLPGSASLEEAFAKASGLIAQREDAEHQVHSNPQLFVGAQMRDKLRSLEGARTPAGHGPVIVRR